MQLQFFLGNDLIETVHLQPELIRQPGYLGSIKRLLKQKHTDLIQQENCIPEFLLVPLQHVPAT